MKPIDPVMVKKAIKEGQLKVYCSRHYDGMMWIYLKDTQTGDTVKIGEVEVNDEN